MGLVEEHDLPLFHRALRCHATIEDMAVVTWAVPVPRVTEVVPGGLDIVTWPTPFGRRALLSTVAYRYRNLWFRGLPFVSIRAVQVHHRVHVRVNGQLGVWFLGTWIDNRRGDLPRRLWAMPWWRAEIGLAASWDGPRLVDHRAVVGEGSGQGALHLEAPDDDDRVPPEVADLVVNPDRGWWHRTRGDDVGVIDVGHRPQRGQQAAVRTAHFRPLLDLGIVDEDSVPWFARVVRHFEIAVGTPPRVMRTRRPEVGPAGS